MASGRGRVLVDTSAWIEALRRGGKRAVQERVRALLLEGRAAWSDMIVLELWNGARGDAEKRTIEQMAEVLDSLTTTGEVWSRAHGVAKTARKHGKTIPATDVLIFATAQHYGVGIEHCDEDFDVLAKLHET